MDFFDFFFLTHDTQKTIPITVRGGKKNIYIYKMEILQNWTDKCYTLSRK